MFMAGTTGLEPADSAVKGLKAEPRGTLRDGASHQLFSYAALSLKDFRRPFPISIKLPVGICPLGVSLSTT